MQLRTTMSYALAQVKIAMTKKSTDNNCYNGVKKRGHFYRAAVMSKVTATREDSIECLRSKNIADKDPAALLPSVCAQQTRLRKDMEAKQIFHQQTNG